MAMSTSTSVRARAPLATLAAVLMLAWTLAALSSTVALAEPVGTVTAVQGEAFARAEQSRDRRALAPGDTVARGDVLTTGPDGRLHLDLADGGALQLGARAAFVVDDLALGEPMSQVSRTTLRLLAGPFRLVGDHAGGRVRTPVATLGIRGTDVWGGFIDGGFGVLLVEGVVDVITAGGIATLDEPGEGVTVVDATRGPEGLRVWPADKVARAVATVTLDQ